MGRTNNLIIMRYTKWIPLGNYNHSESEYIVFVRKNIKTGMMRFKVKRVNYDLFGICSRFIPVTMINTQNQWDKISLIDHQNEGLGMAGEFFEMDKLKK